jgi:hypothetical protein
MKDKEYIAEVRALLRVLFEVDDLYTVEEILEAKKMGYTPWQYISSEQEKHSYGVAFSPWSNLTMWKHCFLHNTIQ